MEEARERLLRLFTFLEAFNERRNPVVSDVKRYDTCLWWRDIPRVDAVRLNPQSCSLCRRGPGQPGAG